MLQDDLPHYEELMRLEEDLPAYSEPALEELLRRFAPRWDNQRVSYHSITSLTSVVRDKDHLDQERFAPILDRMEDYRLKDQEWHSQNRLKMKKITESLYHTHSTSHGTPLSFSRMCHRVTLSIVKERDLLLHGLHRLKRKKGSDRPFNLISPRLVAT
ncbi:hypothetical protein DM01DRAFT_1334035 [Hesseltinella vesiculosa]|uniref:Uncharacterized protein n=1 Tax=Hesseltinella vesiculosa TaxID=101127 RepID=A0A1X2GMM3_9FUNG|nr:hypothetical protein DM01DRAFT_1334035 [Hesseltinella vesiculosa]